MNRYSGLSYHPNDLTKHRSYFIMSINSTNNDVKWSVMEPDLRMREFSYGLQLTVIIYPCRMLTWYLYLLYCSNFDIATFSSFGAFLQPHTSETATSDLPLALPMFRSGNQSSSRSGVGFMVCMNSLDAVIGEEVCLEFRISNQIWESSHSSIVRFLAR